MGDAQGEPGRVTGLGLFRRVGIKRKAPLLVDRDALATLVGQTSHQIYAPGSWRSYDSWVRGYLDFAAAIEAPHDPGCPPGVPVTFRVLLEHFVWYVALKPNQQRPGSPHSAKSCKLIVAALRAAARTDSWAVTDANRESYKGLPGFAVNEAEGHLLSGIIKALAKMYPTSDASRKLPMRLAYLRLIWAKYRDDPTWASTRDQTWQGLGHQGLLRVGEICQLRMKHVSWFYEGSRLAGAQVHLATSKTADILNTETGGVQLVTLAKRPDDCDVVGPLWAWMLAACAISTDGLAVAERADDLLFPMIQGGKLPITKDYVSKALRAGLITIGVESSLGSNYSGRSLRAGGATDMRDSGVEWHVIVMQGRWRSDAWKRYFRESPDVIGHLLRLRPVGLDVTRHLPPSTLGLLDEEARRNERLPQWPVLSLEASTRLAGDGDTSDGLEAFTTSGVEPRVWAMALKNALLTWFYQPQALPREDTSVGYQMLEAATREAEALATSGQPIAGIRTKVLMAAANAAGLTLAEAAWPMTWQARLIELIRST